MNGTAASAGGSTPLSEKSVQQKLERLRDLDRLRCQVYSNMGEILRMMHTEVFTNADSAIEWAEKSSKVFPPFDSLTDDERTLMMEIYDFNQICRAGNSPIPKHIFMHRSLGAAVAAADADADGSEDRPE